MFGAKKKIEYLEAQVTAWESNYEQCKAEHAKIRQNDHMIMVDLEKKLDKAVDENENLRASNSLQFNFAEDILETCEKFAHDQQKLAEELGMVGNEQILKHVKEEIVEEREQVNPYESKMPEVEDEKMILDAELGDQIKNDAQKSEGTMCMECGFAICQCICCNCGEIVCICSDGSSNPIDDEDGPDGLNKYNAQKSKGMKSFKEEHKEGCRCEWCRDA